MCGRYQFSDEKDIEEIRKILEAINNKYNVCKTGEIFPADDAPVLSAAGGNMSLCLMRWGFSKWDGRGVIINAKSETASSKKMFAEPLYEKRCVIPSTGFYEWRKKDNSKVKDKFLFNCVDSPMLYMAGIYNVYKFGEEYRESFVILTRAANSSIADIHDRMPVILYKNELKLWLTDERFIDYAFKRDDIVLDKKSLSSS